MIRDYGRIEKRLLKFPKTCAQLENAVAIQAYLLSHYAAETPKRTLEGFSACADWAISKKLISENPFRELVKEIKPKKSSKVSCKPFSRKCVAAIISAFENNTYRSKFSPVHHSYYLPYVKFLFHTGCRSEEAIALKWKHVEKNRIFFCEAVATDVRIRKPTKTNTPRYFPINKELQTIFDTDRPEHCDPNALVFPARSGKVLDAHNFLNRV
jgi:integrase